MPNIENKMSASFPVRRMDYTFEDVERYWMNNEPAFTHYFTGLSTLFPEGESFFVRSVRAVRHKLQKGSQLDKDVGAFIGQEAMHSKEHEAFHISAQKHGLDPASLERVTGLILKTIERFFPEKWNLLVTVGLEHYTAVMVAYMMESVNELMPNPSIRDLWLWHSIEETEHKAVAFDVYEKIYGKSLSAYIPRVLLFTFSFSLISALTLIYQFTLMYRDKQFLNFKSWRKFYAFSFQSYKKMMPKFLQYYRFNFHPNDADETDLVEETKKKIGLA
ncbi:hypothetical protein MA04_04252 [Alcanivorax balearicus MACL04]|uniref:Metal-dependent hydrolase n=1 Tax=Alloalcanivorax balearicus MACL04 TaxID=1177182 RepID=A0ABT2R590_9GAMM|nr:metal-dependent hydrolase [Alloalcanivorax balearicus]MCU5784952.1 hypothetical protein [Alloalcanivorax balearicus MACL04]